MTSRLLAAALAALLLPATAGATDVIGNLNVDSRWSLAGSPYRLTGDVTVAPQSTLTIEPGVIVEAADTDALGAGNSATQVELIVRGALLADGSAESPVVFRAATPDLDAWYGISFEPGARASSVTYATIADASYALWSRSTAAVALSDLTVSSSTGGLLWQTSLGPTVTRVVFDRIAGTGMDLADSGGLGATATIVDCELRHGGGTGIVLHPGVTATVDRSRMVRNRIGLEAQAGSSLTFTNNVVVGNSQLGLSLDQSGANVFSIVNNTIDQNEADPFAASSTGTGVLVTVSSAPSFVIRNNLITSHGTYGLQVTGPTQPSLDHNDVWGNGTNYQGAVAGVGSISTNPLYVQPYGGSGAWSFVASPISLRNPGNGYSRAWDLVHPGAASIRAVVTYLSTESCCDYLRFYDAAGAQVDSMSGSVARTTAYATGESLRVTFNTDGSVLSSGFDISGYEYTPSGFNYRLQSTSPAIDVGNDLGAPLGDSDATGRPYDGDVNGTATTDLGAYEWHQNIAPFAVAGPDRVVLPNTPVDFSSLGSRDPDGTIVSTSWSFGDGSPADSNPSATHTYSALGVYTVTLTVTDDLAVIGTDTATVTVTDNLPPVADAGPDQFVAVAQAVSLDGGGSTDADGTVVGYAWDFGDGAPAGSGRTVTHTWPGAGVYTVTLTVTDDRGATGVDTAAIVVGGGGGGNLPPLASAGGPYSASVGQAITFDGSGSSDPDGAIASYRWELGDGQLATGVAPSHTYAAAGTYLVRLTVTDDDGATDESTVLVTISAPGNDPPVADAGGNRSADVGESLLFDGTGSTDPDGSIVAWGWDFGDGSSGAGAQATHPYAAAGTYLVWLTVTDDDGAIGQDVAVVTVGGAGNRAPVADAGGNQQVEVGVTVLLDGSASFDPDGALVSYSWDLGDGAGATGAQASHAYAEAGSYLVRLTVTDDDGDTGEDFVLVTVGGGGGNNQLPVANAGPEVAGNAGEALVFNGAGSSDPDGELIAYQWDFGDGGSATGLSATHVYQAGGSYTVTLTVIDDQAGRATATTTATVNALPLADAGPARAGQVGAQLAFDGGGSTDPDGTIAAYAWDFGDGSRGEGQTVNHAFEAAGSFTVVLTVTDDAGARGEATVQVVITAADAGGGPGADTGGAGEASEESGCGCSNAGSGGAGFGWLGLGLLGLVLRRKRR